MSDSNTIRLDPHAPDDPGDSMQGRETDEARSPVFDVCPDCGSDSVCWYEWSEYYECQECLFEWDAS